jgi:DNA-binding NtrC family response regulator
MILAYGLVPERSVAQSTLTAAVRLTNAAEHRVIVVDDVTDVLVSVGAFLVNAGFAVTKASNGDEALRVIAGDPGIDVLVTDFAMPGLNGADLIAQAAMVRPSLKALVITGYPNADGLNNLPTGTMVLTKPFRRDALVAAVKSLFVSDSAGHDQAAKVSETVSDGREWPLPRQRDVRL